MACDSDIDLLVAERHPGDRSRKVRTKGRGRVVDEWKFKPTPPDNHWFDGILGCAVAASIQGVSLPGTESHEPKVRQRVKLSELRKTRGR